MPPIKISLKTSFYWRDWTFPPTKVAKSYTKLAFPKLLIAQSKDGSIYLNSFVNLIDSKKVITSNSHEVDGVQWVSQENYRNAPETVG